MNDVHDMGGMHGLGRVEPEENEPAFHEPWESRVFGIHASRRIQVPGGRLAIESIEPARYLAYSYYARWLEALEMRVISGSLISRGELDASQRHFSENPDAEVARRNDPKIVTATEQDRPKGRSPRRGVLADRGGPSFGRAGGGLKGDERKDRWDDAAADTREKIADSTSTSKPAIP